VKSKPLREIVPSLVSPSGKIDETSAPHRWSPENSEGKAAHGCEVEPGISALRANDLEQRFSDHERRHPNVVSVALANKNARIVWAMLARDEDYRPGQTAAGH
jgi:hypothetical protein